MSKPVMPDIMLRKGVPGYHLWPGIQAADASDVHVPGHEADARPARLGHLLQALHKGGALAQVRPGVPVVDDVIQQIRMPKPEQAARASLSGPAERSLTSGSSSEEDSAVQSKAAGPS